MVRELRIRERDDEEMLILEVMTCSRRCESVLGLAPQLVSAELSCEKVLVEESKLDLHMKLECSSASRRYATYVVFKLHSSRPAMAITRTRTHLRLLVAIAGDLLYLLVHKGVHSSPYLIILSRYRGRQARTHTLPRHPPHASILRRGEELPIDACR